MGIMTSEPKKAQYELLILCKQRYKRNSWEKSTTFIWTGIVTAQVTINN